MSLAEIPPTTQSLLMGSWKWLGCRRPYHTIYRNSLQGRRKHMAINNDTGGELCDNSLCILQPHLLQTNSR